MRLLFCFLLVFSPLVYSNINKGCQFALDIEGKKLSQYNLSNPYRLAYLSSVDEKYEAEYGTFRALLDKKLSFEYVDRSNDFNYSQFVQKLSEYTEIFPEDALRLWVMVAHSNVLSLQHEKAKEFARRQNSKSSNGLDAFLSFWAANNYEPMKRKSLFDFGDFLMALLLDESSIKAIALNDGFILDFYPPEKQAFLHRILAGDFGGVKTLLREDLIEKAYQKLRDSCTWSTSWR